MSELDQAIVALLDPRATQEVKNKAFEYTQSVKRDPGFISFAMEKSLELNLDHPQALNLVFFYLQSIQELVDRDYDRYSIEQRAQMHQYLELILTPRSRLLQTHPSLMNKLAVVYVKVLSYDFPDHWPAAFAKLMEAATSDHTKKFFLTVLKIFNEDFVELREEHITPVANRLKEVLRKQVITSAAGLWKQYLTSDSPEIATATLLVLADYIDWIPLEVALEFLPFVEKFQNTARMPALKCLNSLITKGMDPNKKLELINQLGVITFLQSLHIEKLNFDLTDEPAAAALLVNSVGVQLIKCGAWNQLQQPIEMALMLLNSPEPTISKMVFEFVSEYVRAVKLKTQLVPPVPLTAAERGNIGNICLVLMKQCQLPSEFEHVGPENSEEEDQFYKYRKELSDIFKNLLGVESTMDAVLDYFVTIVQDVTSRLGTVKAEELEVLLFLLCQFADCVADLKAIILTENKFSALVGLVVSSGLKDIPHKIVVKQFLEFAVRYSAYFDSQARAGLLTGILQSLLGQLNSADGDMTRHCAYLLQRLIVKLPAAAIGHAGLLLREIQARLGRPIEDQAGTHLVKAFGLLIANPAIGLETQKAFLQAYISSLSAPLTPASLNRIEETISGFTNKVPVELRPELIAIAHFLSSNLTSPTVQLYEAAVHLAQKLTSTLQDAGIAAIGTVIARLYAATSIETLDSLLKLVTNAVVAFKQTPQMVIPAEVLAGVVSGVMTTVARPDDNISAVSQQIAGIRRTWVKLLEILEARGLDLFSICDSSQLITYICEICDNLKESGVRIIQTIKIALSLLIHMIARRRETSQLSPALQMAVSRVVPITQVLLGSGLNIKTAEGTQIAGEVVLLHREVLRLCKRVGLEVEYAGVLQGVIPAVSFAEYCSLLGVLADLQDTVDIKQQLARLKELLTARQ